MAEATPTRETEVPIVGDGPVGQALAITLGRRAALGTALAAIAAPAHAQPAAWTSRPIRCLVGAGAGGTTDILARLIAPALSERLGQPVVVENKPGGGGTLAAGALVQGRPDGQTMMVLNNSHAVAAAMLRRLPFDPVGDFAPVTILATGPLVVLTAPEGPYTTLPALLAAARSRPETLNLATVGVGSTQHFVAAALEAAAGVRFTHVPYGGTPAALVALRSGEVQAVVETASAVLGQLRASEVRAIAVGGAGRSEILPAVPTVAESGLPEFDLSTWYVLAFAAGTPTPILARAQAGAARVLARPELRQRFLDLGLVPIGSGPEEARELIRRQVARAAEIRLAAGIPQQ